MPVFTGGREKKEMSKTTFLKLAAANFVAATIVGFVTYVATVNFNAVTPIPVSSKNICVIVGVVFGLGFWVGSFFGSSNLSD